MTYKTKCIRHTQRRLRERYNLDIDESDYEDMLSQAIEEPDTLVIHRDDGSSLHAVIAHGQQVIVLLDATGTVIKTAYPPDADVISKPWISV